MERKHLMNFALITTFLTGCGYRAIKTPDPESPSMTPTPITETFTPFQPEAFIPFNSTETLIVSPTPEKPIPYKMFGIDFADSSKPVGIKISLSDGKVFNVNSTPDVCETTDTYHSQFTPGTHNSCAYQPKKNSEDLFLFGHSGWFHKIKPDGTIDYIKLETEDIRHWLEDSGGYNPDVRLPLEGIQKNMESLVGARIEITQGDNKANNLRVLAVVRVPPDKLGPFLDVCPNIGASQPHVPEGMKLDANGNCVGPIPASTEYLTNEDIMSTLAGVDQSVAAFTTDGKPQIVLMLCGWHNGVEDATTPNPGPGYYSWSRYAIVLGK